MISSDAHDREYANTLKVALGNLANLSPEEIEDKLLQVNDRFFPDNNPPNNLLLRLIYFDVQYELSVNFPSDHQKEVVIERLGKNTADYLSGNYATFFRLLFNYTDDIRGYVCIARADNKNIVISCGNSEIANKIQNIANSLHLTGENEYDLKMLQNKLPQQLDGLELGGSEIQELLA